MRNAKRSKCVAGGHHGCVCATSAIYEVTDEWQPHKWSGLIATPYEPEDA